MKSLINAIKVTLVFMLICGIIYPLVGVGIGKVFMSEKANGSLIKENGQVVGSKYIGQDYDKEYYFKGRPSTILYSEGKSIKEKTENSGGNEVSPYSKEFKSMVMLESASYKEKGLKGDVPEELVTRSASGLDPNISEEAAIYQVPYISKESKIPEDRLKSLIKENSESYFGKTYVNLLKLNIAVSKEMNK